MVRGERLSEVLRRAKALEALLTLLHDGPMGPSALQERIAGYSGSGKALSWAFRDAGLATIKEDVSRFGQPVYEIRLTPLGTEVAKVLDKAAGLLPDDEDEPPKRKR